MKIIFTPEADEHADLADQWWRENRPAAPTLFRRELQAALRLIASSPSVGTVFKRNARRIRMPRTRHHVYYVVDADQALITVVAVWGMPKGKTPKL
mgnify:CR=1 FL=1